MKLSRIFWVYQYHQITDEELYYSDGHIPVYTGSNELKGYWNQSFGEKITLPCLTYSVKGFDGVISVQETVFDANNSAVLCVREEYREEVVLEWFQYVLPHYFYKVLVNRGGVSYLSKERVEDLEIPWISRDRQLEQLITFKKLGEMYHILTEQKRQIQCLMEKQIFLSEEIQDKVPLCQIFKYVSRNDCLSESGLYQRSASTEEQITVLSGSSGGTVFGRIDSAQKGIHWLDNRQALHLISRGNAGKLTFLEKGRYATNTNAFLLYIPYDYWGKLGITNESDERIYLKYLKCYLQPLFYEVSSNSDLSVFPLTDVRKNMKIPFFHYNAEMEKIIKCVERLEKLNSTVMERLKKVERLRSYEVVD